ncbi:NADH dehydrogenase [ubiquinone] 1 beta subcomplex subunit 11, mitochondrial [Anthonomus grandis grandis]|uniref:NADH dehydrogenase [ubiquinone] 1 beta subcomplex subunit 11, mitochondrial n=1 Tax=Anthonomus grandis grandis TaxID=2921223 RepID=UPI0021655ADC|nr:NADH dehydrogenase [ubiquinone] 1 beta subcomplex subunit 11, mitochondrial [Anthonomus grandis grandis]
MANFSTLNRLVLQKIRPTFQRRLVSTSKKNNDTVVADVCQASSKKAQTNWISYGYDVNSKVADRSAMHSIMFASITLCLVVGGFVWAYAPDYNLRDWSTREAFLELKRREMAGKPLVDPDFIPAEKIVLPTDEELGNTEIII